jgi:hypothetical protein
MYDQQLADREAEIDRLEDRINEIRAASDRRSRADHAVAEDLSRQLEELRAAGRAIVPLIRCGLGEPILASYSYGELRAAGDRFEALLGAEVASSQAQRGESSEVGSAGEAANFSPENLTREET